MKVTILESTVGPGRNQHILASYVVNDRVAIDGGCVGFASPLELQKKIEHVFLSHSHMDHIASVPIFIDNVYVHGPGCPTIYANAATIQTLKTDIFNDRIWPDMIRLSAEESPFLKLEELSSEVSVDADGVRVTPVNVDHVVPTMSFIIDDGEAAVAIVSDTSPTQRVWELINQQPRLKAVFLECSFPDTMGWLAEKAKHLCPKLFAAELQKLKQDVPVIAIHIKTAFEPTIISELQALGLPNLEIGVPGKSYEWK